MLTPCNNKIACLLSTTKLPNAKFPTTVKQYAFKDGSRMTESITELDSKNNLGIRKVYKDVTGKIQKVIDDVYGRKDVYTQGKNGVMLDNKYEMPFSTLNKLDINV